MPYYFFRGMIDKTVGDQVFFHKALKHQRLDNPTFCSSFVNDSLTLFTPGKVEKQGPSKESEYKRNFEGVNKVNTLGVFQPSLNYSKFTKEAFENRIKDGKTKEFLEPRNKSTFSQHGSNILNNQSSEWSSKQ